MTTNITCLEAPNYSTSLVEVRDILRSAQTKVTLWGNKVVIPQGSPRSFYFNQIADKILRTDGIFSQRRELPLTLDQKAAGREIIDITKRMYKRTDEQFHRANYVTQLLCIIWDLFHDISRAHSVANLMYTNRWYIEMSQTDEFFN